MKRTWPYGTRKTGRVVEAMHTQKGTQVVTVLGHDEEGYILIRDYAPVELDALVTIEFTQGGPTGGYWKIV